ncbi:hypothetical protein, partial [Aeromonas caviae]|uniref:hypothetical protein n=1 Tax=Aeromonas caviae TaxID=648 RepID=UPI001CC73683
MTAIVHFDEVVGGRAAPFHIHRMLIECGYLVKMDDSRHWGADRELAKASSKKGKKSGQHPFGLLA